MSITVKDCLSLPSLRMGRVIAGRNGLSGIVNSVTVLEFDLTADDIYSPNELAITAFFEVKDNVDEQVRTVYATKRSGNVGLVLFYSDMILKGIDSRVTEAADKAGLPLILLPEKDMGLKYSDVIRDVMEAVFLDARSKDFYIDNTMNRIGQMPEKRRTLNNVLGLVSEYTRATVALCDAHGNILGHSFWPAGNIFDIKEALSLKSNKNIYRHEFTDKNNNMLIIYALNKYSVISKKIMSETATIIQLYSAVWNINLNTESREGLIPFMLKGKIKQCQSIAKINNVNIYDFKSMFITESDKDISGIKKIISEYDPTGLTDRFSKYIICFSSLEPGCVKEKLLIERFLEITENKVFFASSDNIPEKCSVIYEMYCSGKNAAESIFPSKKIITLDLLSFSDKCLRLSDENNEESSYYKSLLAPVLSAGDDELCRTLMVYLLDASSCTKKTSEILYVHRNTVKYRLDRIKSLLSRDFEMMPFSYDVYMAAAMLRLEASDSENVRKSP